MHEGEPVGGVEGKKSHGVAFVDSQADADDVAEDEHQLLNVGTLAFDHAEGWGMVVSSVVVMVGGRMDRYKYNIMTFIKVALNSKGF